jgi:hypothetical protein
VESSKGVPAKRPGGEDASGRRIVSGTLIWLTIACGAALLLYGSGTAASQMPIADATPADFSPRAPEIGRCELASWVKEGRWRHFFGQSANPGCTTAAPDGGKFQWRPGVEGVGFTGSATVATFAMVKKPRIRCTGASGTGEYAGTTTLTARFTFTNCTSGMFVCHVSGQPPGVIVTSLLAGEVGLLDDAEGRVGMELSPTSASEPDFADFECPLPVRLKGSIVGRLHTIDRMSTTIRVHFAAKNGVQKYAGLEGREPALLTLTAGSGENAHTESAALKMRITDTSEQAVEIRAERR